MLHFVKGGLRASVALLFAASAFGSALTAQQDTRSFRNPRMAERITTTRDAVDSLARESRAIRKALVDSALGTAMWLEFSAEQQSAERRAGPLDAVVRQFLARHRAALGMDDPAVQLRESRRDADAGMVHLRIRQD